MMTTPRTSRIYGEPYFIIEALEHRCDGTPFNLRSIIRPDLHRLIAQAVSHTADRNNEPQMPAIARKG